MNEIKLYLIIIILSIGAGIIIYKKKLTISAAILAWTLGIIIFYCGGELALGAILLAFILMTLSDKLKETKEDKTRNIFQIICNVLTSALSLVLYHFTNNISFYISFYAVIGGSLADTLASSVGTLSKKKPVNIFTFKSLETGESGGISLLGLFISLVGGMIMGFVYLLSEFNLFNFILISIMGLIGSLIDSILGIIFEIKYECIVCHKQVEKSVHCHKKTKKLNQFKFMDNNTVNLLSNILVFILTYLILN